MMEGNEKQKSKKRGYIFWAICLIPLVIGIILLTVSVSKETTEYSTDEYWVAQGYHHVFERYSGQIVDLIEDNESCKIDGDTIIVVKTEIKSNSAYVWGIVLTTTFGLFTIGGIIGAISISDWWNKLLYKLIF